MSPPARATAEERRERLDQVCRMLARAMTPREIARQLRPEWGVTSWSVRAYIRAARKVLQLEANAETRAGIVAELREIQRRAAEDGDHHAALKAADARARIAGVAPLNWRQVQHTHEIVGPQPAVIAEVRKPTAELAVEARALVAANAPIADDEEP